MRRITLKMMFWLMIVAGILLAMSLSGCDADHVGPKSHRNITVESITIDNKNTAEYVITTGPDGTSLRMYDTIGKFEVYDTLILIKKPRWTANQK